MTTTRSTRRGLLALASTLVVVAAAASAGASPAQADGPTTHTVTFQCDPNLPGYGTNSAGGQQFQVKVGDILKFVFQGPACGDGSMHFRGDWKTMYESTPAWSGSCCDPIPDGTVYTMRVKQWSSDSRYGQQGWAAFGFYTNRYASMQQVYPVVELPPASAPYAPTLSNARPGERDVWIDFKPGFDGWYPVNYYEYRIISPTVQRWVRVPANHKVLWIYGLNPATQYQVEMRAVNWYGEGEASKPITFRTRSMPPGAPTNLVAEPNDESASISFIPGTDGGSDIVKYQYQLDDGAWMDAEGKSSPVTIPGLENYRTYSIKLRAINEGGEIGAPSDAVVVEPGPGPVTIEICHWTGDGFEQATTTDAVFRGKGEHADDDQDIIPWMIEVGNARNWDYPGVMTWLRGCKSSKPVDTDKDGKIDLVDTDDDGDGIPDASDRDDDGDGIADVRDRDFGSNNDFDGDGVPNVVDPDDDNDGIEDAADTDRDGNGAPDVTQADLALPEDSDGDGTPDYQEGDKDGDCIVDVKDADDNGDGVVDSLESVDVNGDGIPEIDDRPADEADRLSVTEETVGLNADDELPTCRYKNVPAAPRDRDQDGTPDFRDRDIDGDGIPNAKDPDVDGDGVLDTRDGDANGDGIVETKEQLLVTAFTAPALKAGKATTIPRSALQTVAGQTAGVGIECVARVVSKAKGAIAPAGDIAAPSSKELCEVVQKDGGVQITVTGDQPTLVTIRLTAPATGEYKAFRQVEQVVVR